MARFSHGVDIAFRARLQDFKKEVESIPGITKKESRKMLREWRKAQKDQEKLAADGAKVWQKATGEITGALSEVVPGLGAVQKATEAWSEASDAADASTARLWKRIGLLSGAVAVIGGATAWLHHLQQAREELVNLSAETGLATDTLSAIQLAADRSGVEFEELADATRDFGEVIFDFTRGGGRAEEALADLGIQLTDTEGKSRSLDTVFRETVTALQQVEDPTRRVAYAQQLMGDSGARLVRILGDLDLNEYVRLAAKFGLTVGPEAAEATRAWEDATGGLRIALRSVALQAGETMAAFVGQDSLTSAVVEFSAGMVGGVEIGRTLLREFSSDIVALAKATKGAVDDILDGSVDRTSTYFRDVDGEITLSTTTDPQEELRLALADLATGGEEVDLAFQRGLQTYQDLKDLVSAGLTSRRTPGVDTAPEDEGEESEFEKAKALQEDLDALHEESIWAWLEREVAADEAATKSAEEWKERELAAARQVRDARLGLATSLIGLSDTVLSTVEGNLDSETKEDKKAAKAIFATRKALAITNAVISTAAGVMKAIEMWGPPPSPMGILGIAAAAVTGATQTALIAAQKPTFHVGGVGTSTGPAPDEMDMRILRSEFGGMLTATGMKQLGGPEAVHSANRGEGGGGTTVIAPVLLSGRVVEMGMVDAMQGTSSEVRSAVRRASRRPGHR